MKFYTNVILFGNYILVRGYENEIPFKEKVEYKPTLHIPSNKPSEWTTLDGQYVAPIQPGTIKETKEFISKYDDVENFKIFGNQNYVYTYISEEYPGEIEYDFNLLKVANIDIETGSENGFPKPELANEEVIAISMEIQNHIHVWGCGEYQVSLDNVTYYHCQSESHLLQEFMSFWKKNTPDIMTGWNIKTFDIPYLVNRMNKLFDESFAKDFSPWKSVRLVKSFGLGGRDIQTYDIDGVSILDYLDLYRKFTYTNQESYSLNHISYVELGEKKIDYSEFENLHQLYKFDYQKFIDYNIKDVQLVTRLDDKMKFLEMAAVLAYDAKVNFVDIHKQVRMWDAIIYNDLKEKNIVMPPKKNSHKAESYAGAYVKNPIVGQHNWVVSFDLASLYPHLIMQFNISPETLVSYNELINFEHQNINVDTLLEQSTKTEHLSNYGLTVTPNNQYFKIEKQGFLPEIMERLFNDRTVYKKEMLQKKQELENETDPINKRKLTNRIAQLNNLQMARKIQLNSAYGAIGNQYFRFYDLRIAEAITLSGQLVIRWIERDVNNFLNKLLGTEDGDYVIAIDTDSIYVRLDGLVEKVMPNETDPVKVIDFLDKVTGDKMQDIIDKSYQNLKDYTNAYAQKMKMKREVLADKGIWTGKKHYVLNVYDNEGVRYAKPKLKVMGLEMVKSSTPSACRVKMEDTLNLIMNGTEDDVQQFIAKFREEFKTLPIEDISFPRSVQGLSKYSDSNQLYIKGTPIHVKGSLIHNKLLKEKKLTTKYLSIQEGEKIKFTYLKTPNPTGDTVIAMLNTLPKEFDLQKYVDYDTQFDKSFVEPVKAILDVIGWTVEKQNTLESFFG